MEVIGFNVSGVWRELISCKRKAIHLVAYVIHHVNECAVNFSINIKLKV